MCDKMKMEKKYHTVGTMNLSDRTSLGPNVVCGIDRCSVYTGKINKYFVIG